MRKLQIKYLPPHIRERLSKVKTLYVDDRNNWVAICSNGEFLTGDDKDITPVHANCIELKGMFDRAFTSIDSNDIDELDRVVGGNKLISIFGSVEYNSLVKNKEYVEKQYSSLVAYYETQNNTPNNSRRTKQTMYGTEFKDNMTLDEKIAVISVAIDYYYTQLGKRIDKCFENYDKEKGTNVDFTNNVEYSKEAKAGAYSAKIQNRLRVIQSDKSSEQSLEAERITAEYLKIKNIQSEFKNLCDESMTSTQVVSRNNTHIRRSLYNQ